MQQISPLNVYPWTPTDYSWISTDVNGDRCCLIWFFMFMVCVLECWPISLCHFMQCWGVRNGCSNLVRCHSTLKPTIEIIAQNQKALCHRLCHTSCRSMSLPAWICTGSFGHAYYMYMAVSILWPLYQNSRGQSPRHVFRKVIH